MLISVCALSLGKRTDEFLMNKNVTWLSIAQTQHCDWVPAGYTATLLDLKAQNWAFHLYINMRFALYTKQLTEKVTLVKTTT